MTAPGPQRPKKRTSGGKRGAARFGASGGAYTAPTSGTTTDPASEPAEAEQEAPENAPESPAEPQTPEPGGDLPGGHEEGAETSSDGSSEEPAGTATPVTITPELVAAVQAELAKQGKNGTDPTQGDGGADADAKDHSPGSTPGGRQQPRSKVALPDLDAYEPDSGGLSQAELDRWRYTLGLKVRGARSAHDKARGKHSEWIQEVADARSAGVPESEIAAVAAQARYPVPTEQETGDV